jgi:pantothenate synthetase
VEISRFRSLSETERDEARSLVEELSSVLKSSHGKSAKKEKAANSLMKKIRDLNQISRFGEDAYLAISDIVTRLIS